MYLRVVCLLLAAVTVSADDLLSAQYLQLTATPPEPGVTAKSTLDIYINYGPPGSMSYLTKLVLLVSNPGEDTIDHILAYKDRTGQHKGTVETDIGTAGYESTFFVHWLNESDGYCRTYEARVYGVDANGKEHYISKKIQVGTPEGAVCDKPVQIPEAIQNNFPQETYEQQVQILNKINSIDKNTYKISKIYRGRVYLASMKDKNFQLHKMNELCKTAGGYLVELEDEAEQMAVREFLKDIGSYNYYTGGNDVDNEGHFVFYNSKKPMTTNLVWEGGEPNNDGNEDCVEIRKNGLNDNQCKREHGYLCEIHLL